MLSGRKKTQHNKHKKHNTKGLSVLKSRLMWMNLWCFSNLPCRTENLIGTFCGLLSAQHSNQSPISLTSDSSSPRPYVSPRNGTPQNNQKSLMGVHQANMASTQTRVSWTSRSIKSFTALKIWFHLLCLFLFSICLFPFLLQGSMSAGKQGSLPISQTTDKRPEDPRTLQQRR